MSLAAICTGNFHQLRNNFGSNCRLKLVRFHSGLSPGKAVNARRCAFRPLATNIEGQNQKSKSSKQHNVTLNLPNRPLESLRNIKINKSEPNEIQAVQCYNLQQISENKVCNRPATIIVIDIETTGFSRQYERIIEFAARDLIGGKNSTFETLVNPGKVIRNAHIHGIRTNMVNRPDVPRFEELVPILIQYVRSRQMNGKPVVFIAHNGRQFDIPFIIKEFDRCSVEIPDDWLFVDTLPLARQLVKKDGSKLESFSLEALREHYKIPLVGHAHRAMQDVRTLSYVLQKMTFDLKLTVPELMERAFRASDITKSS